MPAAPGLRLSGQLLEWLAHRIETRPELRQQLRWRQTTQAGDLASAVLAPGLKILDDRERRILQLRFYEGLTQSQIAQQVGISQMHVSRLIRRSLEKIREEIAAEEESEPKVARG